MATTGNIDGGNNSGWVFSAPSVGYSLVGDFGVYAVSGIAANIAITNRVIPAASGVYSLTGNAATFSQSRILQGGFETYIISGSDADIVVIPNTYPFSVSTGYYSLNGKDVSIVLGGPRSLAAASGVYGITGYPAQFLFYNGNIDGGGNTGWLFTAAGNKTLTAGLVQNTNNFYSPSVTTLVGLSAALFNNTNTVYAASVQVGTVTLSPSLFVNNNTFYTAQRESSITLSASLFSNSNVFYAATTTRIQPLFAELFTNNNYIYSATVTVGPVTLFPTLFSNTETFYVSTFNYVVSLSLVSNVNVFYTPKLINILYEAFTENYSRQRTVYVEASSTAKERTIAIAVQDRTIIVAKELGTYDRRSGVGEEHRQNYVSRATTTYDRIANI